MPGWHASGEQPPEPDDTTATGWLGVPSAALPLSGLAAEATSPSGSVGGSGHPQVPGAPSVSANPAAHSTTATPGNGHSRVDGGRVDGGRVDGGRVDGGRVDGGRQSPVAGITLPSGPASPGPVAAPSVAAIGLGNSRPARNPATPLSPLSSGSLAGRSPRNDASAARLSTEGDPGPTGSGSTGSGSTGSGSTGSGAIRTGSIGSGSITSSSVNSSSINSGAVGTDPTGGGTFGSRGQGRAATRAAAAQPPAGWGERSQPAFQADWVSATRSSAAPQNTSRRTDDEEGGGDPHGDPGAASLVRPYARTGGRTKPVRHLDLEALVRTSNNGRDALSSPQLNPEHVSVIHMAGGTVSVAEIAARLAVPLGVARVIIADMVDLGLVEVMKTSATQGDERDPAFLRRVLSGLQRL